MGIPRAWGQRGNKEADSGEEEIVGLARAICDDGVWARSRVGDGWRRKKIFQV